LLGLTPLVFLPTGGEFENLPKSVVLQGGVAVLALLGCARGRDGPAGGWTRTPLDLPVALFGLACALSLTRAVNLFEAVPLLLHWGAGVILCFLLIHTLRGPDAVPRIFLAATVGCAAVSLVGLAPVWFGLDWIPQSTPPASTFANRNMAAHHVAICFPLIVGLVMIARRDRTALLAASCLPVCLLYLYHTRSHTAWLAVLVVIVSLAIGSPWLLRATGRPRGSRRLRLVVAALLVGACLVGFVFVSENTEGDEMVSRLAEVTGVGSGTVNMRLVFWQNTLAMARDHPVLGVGLGNFKLQYPLYHRAAKIDWTFNEERQLERVHNDHLQILAELGLVGFVAWVAIFAAAFRIARRGMQEDRAWVRLQLAFVCLGLVVFLTVACSSFPMERAMPPAYLFALLGMAGFLHVTAHGAPRDRLRVPPVIARIGTLWLVVYLSTSMVLTGKALWTEVHYTEGVRLTHAGEHVRALEILEKARRLSPRNVSVLMSRARNQAAIGECERAVETLGEVLRVHPHKVNALSNIGYCYLALQRHDEAAAYYLESLEILPESPHLHTSLGSAYLGQGKIDLAVDTYRKAIELAETRPYVPGVRSDVRLLQPRLLLAHALVVGGRQDEAIELYEVILKDHPDRQDVRRLLAELSQAVDEREKARQVRENSGRADSR